MHLACMTYGPKRIITTRNSWRRWRRRADNWLCRGLFCKIVDSVSGWWRAATLSRNFYIKPSHSHIPLLVIS
ncbi:hypothetical protein HanHA300_Chr13g0470891 [Helianthus annuus]|nr:hypothetical protein HanHA300_Chr13g0470891 [Helianthus annuus]KAJ0662741.1 hypothetical protein HanLR1_Chr13g0473111 [Helianthus annuus]KAJ0670252.1 hypothetical protein HanOQP8_Chr13g0472071 [Helianthus annuus]